MKRAVMFFRLTIAALFLSAAAYAQPASHNAKQLNTLAARNAKQAMERTMGPLPPQPLLPDAATPQKPYVPGDPGSIHYPYGSLGNVDPASRANPYGPYSTTPDSGYGHYNGPTLPQTPNSLFGNPAPAFAIPAPSFAPNNTPAFSRGR